MSHSTPASIPGSNRIEDILDGSNASFLLASASGHVVWSPDGRYAGQTLDIDSLKTITLSADLFLIRLADLDTERDPAPDVLPTNEDFTSTLETLGQLGLAISFFDRNYRLRVVNAEYFDLIGLPGDRFPIGTSIEEMFRYNAEVGEYGEGDIEQMVQDRMKLVREMTPHHFLRERPDGSVLEVAGRPLPYGGFVTVYRNVTEEVRRKEALDRERGTLALTLNTLQTGITLVDKDLTLLVANPSFYRIVDIDPEEFPVGSTSLEDVFRFNAQRGEYGEGEVEDLVQERMDLAGKHEIHHFERARPNGKVIDIFGVPTEDDGFLSVYSDVTELRKSEQETQEQKRWLSTTLDSMTQGVTLFDKDLILQAINPKFFEIMDFPAEKFPIGVHFSEFMRHNAERGEYGPGDVEQQVADRVAMASKFTAHEIIRERPNGSIILIKGLPVMDGDDVVGFITTYSDVTKEKTAERDLVAAKEDAEEALEDLKAAQESLIRSEKMAALGRLVAGVAHEINTPLGNALVLASDLKQRARQLWQRIEKGNVKRSDVAKAFGDFDRGAELMITSLTTAAGLVRSFKSVAVDQYSTPKRSEFNVGTAINDIVETLRPTIKKAGHVIEQNVPSDLILESYSGPFRQVIMNIIQNAMVHAFEDGPGKMSIRAWSLNEQSIQIEISDNGTGMPEAVRMKAFDPFFTTKAGRGGTGLGLNIVHNITTTALAGDVSLDSQPGQGTTFLLTLPKSAPETVFSPDMSSS